MNIDTKKSKTHSVIISNPENDSYDLLKDQTQESTDALLVAEAIKLILNKYDQNIQDLHIYFQWIKNFITSLDTKDPTKVHFDIVRTSLKNINSNLLNEPAIIDRIARQLSEQCKKLKMQLREPKQYRELLDTYDREKKEKFSTSMHNVKISIYQANISGNQNIKNEFETRGMFLWDKAFLDALGNLGKAGKIKSKEYKADFRKRLQDFKDGNRSPLAFWFNIKFSPDNPFHLSPALLIIAEYIFRDLIEPSLNFGKKYPPALTKNVQEPLTKMLSPKNQIISTPNEYQIFHQQSLIGSIQVPAISQKIVASVFNGVKKLNTVTGHRLTRYLVQKAFDQKIEGNSDYRVIKLDRGATEIAEQLDRSSNKLVTNIKEIIHAMAYFEFHGTYRTGNLIQLSKYQSPITKRQEAYEITVGTPLLPYRTYEDGGLLIPLLKDPPLVSPNQSHSGQYLLQMEIMAEFSKQSIMFAKEGVVKITQAQWEQLAQSCELTPEVLRRIQDRWTQDGNDGDQFLEKIENEFYRLGKTHNKVMNFLKDQGFLRINQSNRGITSAINRKKAKARHQKK